MSDPRSMKERDIPRNRDANAAGESCEDIVNNVVHQGCLLEGGKEEEEEEEAEEEEEYGFGVGKGKGKGGSLRVWMMREQSWYRTLVWWSSSSSWCIMILSYETESKEQK